MHMIFVNFKTYPQATAQNAVRLAKICAKVSSKTKVKIIPCVQIADLAQVVKSVKIPVWVQHIDPVQCGKNTGKITALSAAKWGAKGTLINHSEHPLNKLQVKEVVGLAKLRKLQMMVLVKDLELAKFSDKLKPQFIGFEEPDLIGGKVAIVESEKMCQKIKKFVKILKSAKPTVGAGINKKSDVEKSIELGAEGVLVASSVILAPNPEKVLFELASAFI